MRKKLLTFIISSLTCLLSYSQQSDLDSLMQQIEKASTDSIKIQLSTKYAAELTYNNAKESIKLLKQCIEDSKLANCKNCEANALFALAIPYAIEGQYEASLKYMIESSEIYQSIGNKVGFAKCLGGLGNIYYFMNELAKAQEYYEKALAIYKDENSKIGIASCLNNLGLICQQTKNLKKALGYQLEGLKIEEESKNKRGIAISHISISALLIDLGRYSEARKHAHQAINISKSIADTNAMSDGMLRLADCFRLSGYPDSAQFYLNETIRISKKNKDYIQLKYAFEVQVALYDSLRSYHNAYNSLKKLMAVKDSLFNKEKTSQLIEMQTKFDSEQKQKENEILTSKNFTQKLILWGLVIIIALAFLLTLQIFLSKRKLRVSHENLLVLHQEVQQHKEEIETQAESLIIANDAIINQKDQLEHTHQKISDSIVYASFIQGAMLPSDDILSKLSTDFFVLYKPRDVVSGDFYWIKERDDSYIIAVADCTGHGVPGALLSMMGISFLNDIVANISDLSAAGILENLRINVKQALGQYNNNSLRKEGIEIGLVIYNPYKKKITFGGAYISLWVLRNGVMKEYKSDRMSIGISLKETPFTEVEFDIEKGDTIYMFTDGYADQLGGKSKKKFLRRNLIQELSSISNHSLSEQKIHLENLHKTWKGDKFEQIDDILVMGIKF